MEEEGWKRRSRLREIYRYMGMKEQAAEKELQVLVQEQLKRLLSACRVGSCYRIVPLTFDGESDEERPDRPPILYLGGMEVSSRALARNLQGCDQAALFGVTLGLEVDRLIYRLSRTASAEAVITDACAAAAVEAACDELCAGLKEEAARTGRKTRPRFSPGFGDFTLAYQPALFRLLELSKRIGVSLTDGGMMTPAKSVTAVVGFYREE